MTRNTDYRKHGPTTFGQISAVAKGVFLTGEPLVEHAEYMLTRNGLNDEERLKYHARFSRTDVTDRIYEKLLVERDPDIQTILARGYRNGFNKAIQNHEAQDTQKESAVGMLCHLRERKDYIQRVESQANGILRKSWLVSEGTIEVFHVILQKCQEARGRTWVEDGHRCE